MIASTSLSIARIFLLSVSTFFASTALAQERRPTSEPDEVIRITSRLIQTDVMVFDRDGRFVDGLKPEQFELRVDGKPQSVSFFERVTAGNGDEDAQIAAARGSVSTRPGTEAVVKPLDRGRVIFFYLDDLHMASDSLKRTRDSLTQFVEKELGQNDQAGVFTASGQLGFLQQLTSDKFVVLTALNRLKPQPYSVRDSESTPMSEPQALAVLRNDRSVIDYFVEQAIKEQGVPFQRNSRVSQRARDPVENQFEQIVLARAKAIVEYANIITKRTLSGLERLLRAVGPSPGRKLLYFVSDGFYINERSPVTQMLPRITDAAARSGTVVYSIEARGLDPGIFSAGEKTAFDPSGRLANVDAGAATGTQDPLHALAVETGGRALLNSNSPARGLAQALTETSVYYLLAWRPEIKEGNSNKFHNIEARIKGRDDLRVRIRQGFLNEPPPPESEPKPDPPKKSDKGKPEDADLLAALRSLYPKRSLPTSLSVGYTNAASGSVLTASMLVDFSVLSSNAVAGQKLEVDVLGLLISDQGKTVGDFGQRLTIDPTRMSATEQQRIVSSMQVRVAPGLYQVRVATRDTKSARTGSATQWIEIPDVAQGGFSVGSLFVGEMVTDRPGGTAGAPQALINVRRRFSRASRMIFQTYIYNAALSANSPDIALQVQIFRDNQPVVTIPLRRLPTDGAPDLVRLPYYDEVPLDQLPPGRYVLQVAAIDRLAKLSASQRVNFEIE